MEAKEVSPCGTNRVEAGSSASRSKHNFRLLDTLRLPRVPVSRKRNGNGSSEFNATAFSITGGEGNPMTSILIPSSRFGLFKEKLETFKSFLSARFARGVKVAKHLKFDLCESYSLPEGGGSLSEMETFISNFHGSNGKERMQPESMNRRLSFVLPDAGGRFVHDRQKCCPGAGQSTDSLVRPYRERTWRRQDNERYGKVVSHIT